MENQSNPNSRDINNSNDESQQCPPQPFRGSYHRRAHSEVQFRIPDDLDMSDPFSGFDELGTEDDLFYSYMDLEKIRSGSDSSGLSASRPDNGFLVDNVGGGGEEMKNSTENSKPRHRHSLSVDGSSSLESIEAKKAMAPDKLAELWVADPKRAKRIIANRQSAARSKERKAKYMLELERKVYTLQTEATTLSAQLSLFQRDTNGLSSENTELKLRLQAMEQQAQLRDTLSEALKTEVERLKLATGEIPVSSSETYNLRLPQQMAYSQPPLSIFQSQPPQADPSNAIQNMRQTQFHLFQPNMANPNMVAFPPSHLSNAYGSQHGFSEMMQQDSLGQFQGLDINSKKGSNFGDSESVTVSESSSSM